MVVEGARAATAISSKSHAVVPSHSQMRTVCAAVVAVIELEDPLTRTRSTRSPLVVGAASRNIFAAASDAVGVGARVAQAVTAASERACAKGACAVIIELGDVATLYTSKPALIHDSGCCRCVRITGVKQLLLQPVRGHAIHAADLRVNDLLIG